MWKINSLEIDDQMGSSINAVFSSDGKDKCTVILAVDADTTLDAGLVEEASVVIYKADGTTAYFRGVISRISPLANGSNELIQIDIESHWYWLERIVYQQRYALGSASTATYLSRVILGQRDTDGAARTTGQAIGDILAYAATHGSGITASSILPLDSIYFPPVEMVDATCAECIRAILRWHPDTYIKWDHASGAGFLYIDRAANGAALSLHSTGSATVSGYSVGIRSVTIAPREDRKVRGVVINYETTTTVDGVEYVDISQDTGGSNTEGKNVAVFTIPLRGSNTITQSQDIVTADIPEVIGDVNAEFLNNHFPEIKDANFTDGLVQVVSVTQEVDEDNKVGDGTVPSSFPREIINGSVADWMSGIVSAPTTVKIVLKWVGDASTNRKAYDLFKGAKKTLELSYECTGTDAITKTYYTSTFTPGETPTSGLAADYYDAITSPMVEGSISIVEEEPRLSVQPGKLLTLTGDFATPSPTLIHTVATDVFSGRSTVRFGPSNPRLAPPDFIELLRAGTRNRPVFALPDAARTDGKISSSGNETKGSKSGRMKNTSKSTDQKSRRWFTVEMAGTDSVYITEGRILAPDISNWASITWPGPLPDPPNACLKQYTIASDTISGVANGDGIWLKIDFGETPATYKDDESVTIALASDDGGFALSVSVDNYNGTSGEFIKYSVSVPPASNKRYCYILLAEIAIGADGEMTINQRHDGVITIPMIPATYIAMSFAPD